MKKCLLAAACLLALVGKSQAADLSVGLGADYWNPTPEGQIAGVGSDYDNPSLWTYWADLRHGLPLIPNVSLQRSAFDSQAHGLGNQLTAWDLALFYRLFDNDLFGIGGGLNVRKYDGEVNNHSYGETDPMAYLQAEANIPGTTLSGFADARAASWDGNHSHDYRIGAALELIAKFKLRAGYRNVRIDDSIDGVDFSQRMDGWFAGAEYRF